MNEAERKQLAAEMIAGSLARLKSQAVINELGHLAELIEVARAEADTLGQEQVHLSGSSNAPGN
jgi:hypothetical protein